jgi:hypothetical protein
VDAKRSPFSINKVELLMAIGTSIITWFGLHASISSFWLVGLDLSTPLSDLVINKREALFTEWGTPITILLSLSSIFLARGIQNQSIQYFSRASHFLLAWPLFVFPLVTFLYVFSLPCIPLGLFLPVLSLAEPIKSQRWWGGVFTTVWLIGCTIMAWNYFGRIDYLFGY